MEAGLKLVEDELRLPPRDGVDSTYRPAVTLVSAWVSQLARDLDIDTSLLATRADIEALWCATTARRACSPAGGPTSSASPVRDLVEGEAALAFDGDGRLVLEARSHEPAPSAR